MKRLFRTASVLLFLAAHTPARSQTDGIDYLSPLPGSSMVSCGTNIIFRPARGTDPHEFAGRSSIRLTGTRSGSVTGSFRLSDDGRTLTFAPPAPFAPGETVSVEVLPRENVSAPTRVRSFTFSFSVSAHMAEARHVPDFPEPALRAGEPAGGTALARAPLPADFPKVTITQSDRPTPGYLFVSNMTMGSGAQNSPFVIILDNAGQPVFYRRTPSECTDFKVQPNGLLTYDDSFLHCFLALDSTGTVVDTFRCGNGYPTNWHELRLLSDGHALILGDDPQTVRMDSIVPGGSSSALVQGIVIQELDRAKNVVFQWRTFDHFSITDATNEDLTAAFIDYVHANAIEPDTDGTLMLSCRHMDEITKINRQTGEIVWRWGGKHNQFTFVNDSLGFRHQHAIRRLANGNVSLFDNGNTRFPALSRAVEYTLDERNMKATLAWQYRKTPDNYASAMGYVQRLGSGNTIIGWGASGLALTEVRPDGGVALEMTFPAGIYSYRAYRFPWNPAQTAGIAPRALPQSFSLAQNYPNPFNPATNIAYRVPREGEVRLDVVDLLGRNVATLVDGRQEAGDHTVRFDGRALGSGVYFYRLQAAGEFAVKRMLLLR